MIILLYGVDDFRRQEKFKEIRDRFAKNIPDGQTSIFVIDGATENFAKIKETLNTNSLFSNKKMVIINNLFSNPDKSLFSSLLSLCQEKKSDKNDDIIIFCDEDDLKKPNKDKQPLAEYLKKQKFVQEFSHLSPNQLINWVKDRFAKQNIKIEQKLIQLLISQIGYDLWRLDNEINKLSNFSETITAKVIMDNVKGSFDENIFALIDAIAAKNKTLAAKLLEEQQQAGLAYEYILAMCLRQFKILAEIQKAKDSGLNQAKIAEKLGLHPFIVQKGMSQIKGFSLTYLKDISHKLLTIDYLSKLGQADIKTEIFLLIAHF